MISTTDVSSIRNSTSSTRRRYHPTSVSCSQRISHRPVNNMLLAMLVISSLFLRGIIVESFQLSNKRFALRPSIRTQQFTTDPVTKNPTHPFRLPKTYTADFRTSLYMSSIPRIDISILDNPIINLDTVNRLNQLSFFTGFVALLQTIVLSIFRFTIQFVRKYMVVMACIVLIWSVWTVLSSVGRLQKQATAVSHLLKSSNEEPLEFDDDGWGFGTIQSLERFTENSKICTVRLPKRNWYVPLEFGQPLTVCTMIQQQQQEEENDVSSDKNENNNSSESEEEYSNSIITTYADVYPIATHKTYTKLGQVSFVIPNICKHSTNNKYEDVDDYDEEEEDNPLKVLAHTLQVGDQIAIQPSPDGSKLAVATSNSLLSPIELTDYDKIVYVAIGVTGIVPVLEQVYAIVSLQEDDTADEQSSPVVEQITILWICEDADDFDNIFSDQLETLYDNNPETILVSCIVDERIVRGNDDDDDTITAYNTNNDLQESIEQQQYDNDITRSIAIISASGYPPSVTDTAITFLQNSRGFPDQAICVL